MTAGDPNDQEYDQRVSEGRVSMTEGWEVRSGGTGKRGDNMSWPAG